MSEIEGLLKVPPYSLKKREKAQLLASGLEKLAQHHYSHCQKYRLIFDRLKIEPFKFSSPEMAPFIPIRLFKDHDLFSIPETDIFKKLTSSGTTGSKVSKIFLDRETANKQILVLHKILNDFIPNKKRIPMLIIDSKGLFKDRNMFSARGAAILGFSMLGKDITFALDEEMKLNLGIIKEFCEKNKNGPILLFGFTSIIWEFFHNAVADFKETAKIRDLLRNAILIHGGGWKKLADQAITNLNFKEKLKTVFGIERVYNYYGMIEQTGSIFMECEYGHFHSPVFSDVFIRKSTDFSLCGYREIGIVQLVSLLPISYPGHSILTEDVGEKMGEDDCKCGRMGSYFLVHGRIKNAEIRGCSDTYNR